VAQWATSVSAPSQVVVICNLDFKQRTLLYWDWDERTTATGCILFAGAYIDSDAVQIMLTRRGFTRTGNKFPLAVATKLGLMKVQRVNGTPAYLENSSPLAVFDYSFLTFNSCLSLSSTPHPIPSHGSSASRPSLSPPSHVPLRPRAVPSRRQGARNSLRKMSQETGGNSCTDQ
jgi:hypothetical protein